MDETLSPEPDSEVSKELRPESQAFKRRKVVHEKAVVTVKMGSNVGKLKNEGPPSDLWSWRKYGQKPIKGSPYPRGYYRCSTSKGCSAKKQVERSKTDASVLIITYTSSHNHPGPPDMISTANSPPEEPQSKQPSSEQDHDDHLPALLPKQEQDQEQDQHAADHFHYIESPVRYSSQEDPFSGTHDMIMTSSSGSLGLLMDDHEELHDSQLSYSQLINFSTPTKSKEENDFFDELEELPTFSSFPFPSFMTRTTNLSLETIPSVPS